MDSYFCSSLSCVQGNNSKSVPFLVRYWWDIYWDHRFLLLGSLFDLIFPILGLFFEFIGVLLGSNGCISDRSWASIPARLCHFHCVHHPILSVGAPRSFIGFHSISPALIVAGESRSNFFYTYLEFEPRYIPNLVQSSNR